MRTGSAIGRAASGSPQFRPSLRNYAAPTGGSSDSAPEFDGNHLAESTRGCHLLGTRRLRYGQPSLQAGKADRVTTSPWLVVLRGGVVIEDPLSVVLGFLARWRLDISDPSQSASFGEPDLRLANRSGARVSAAQIAAILQRRAAIEPALGAIASHASL